MSAFIAFSVGVGLIGAALTDWAKAWGGEWAELGIGVAIVAVIYAWSLRLWRKLVREPRYSLTGEMAAPARALVVSASPGRKAKSALVAVRHHAATVERVYVLHTQNEVGRAAVETLRRELGSDLAARVKPVGVAETALDDPEVVYAALEKIYEALEDANFEADEVVLDYTGGTRAFAAAMVLFGAVSERRLEYVRPALRGEDGHPLDFESHDTIEIDLRYRVKRHD